MNQETIRTLVAVASILVAAFGFWWNLSGRLTRIETKVDLMWRSWVRRAVGGGSPDDGQAGE